MAYKIFRRTRRQARIEGQHHGHIESKGFKQTVFERWRRQPEQRFAWLEKGAWVRLESHDSGGGSRCPGPLKGCAQYSLMATMYTVEIADGQGCAFQRFRAVLSFVKNTHAGLNVRRQG
jgi:hypothetical protein